MKLDTVAGLPQYHGIDPETGVPIDSKDRYLVPDPANPQGGRKSWQRCTNLASMLDARFALEIHAQNSIIVGLGRRDDLRMLAMAAALNEDRGARDRKLLQQIRQQAEAAGGGDERANRGTGMHVFTEVIDGQLYAGATGGAYPPPINLGEDQQQHAAGLRAYRNCLIRHSVGPALDHLGQAIPLEQSTEVVLHDPRIEVVGRVDKVRRIAGRNRIVDVKTGEDPLKHSALSYAMQLAILAHAPYQWDEATMTHRPAIPVDQEVAYLIHIPSGGDYAELIAIDIAAAWRYVLLAVQVRESRNVPASAIASPLGRVGADEEVAPAPALPVPLEPSRAAAQLVGLPTTATPEQVADVAARNVAANGGYCPQCQHTHTLGSPCPVTNMPPLPDPNRVKVLVQQGERVTAHTPVPNGPPVLVPNGATATMISYGGGGASSAPTESASHVSAVAPVPAAGATSTPEIPAQTPAAGGTEQDATPAAEAPKRKRSAPKCARCRRPGHQTRTCTYLTNVETGEPLVDEKVGNLLQAGGSPDLEEYRRAVAGGDPAVTNPERVDPNADPHPDDWAAAAAENAMVAEEEAARLQAEHNLAVVANTAPPWCTCTSGWDAGWSNRGDGVFVHAACGLPSYAATSAANATRVATMAGQDQATHEMARETAVFFSQNPQFPPPANLIESGQWPPPPLAAPAAPLDGAPPPSSTSAPAAGATTTSAPAAPSGGGTGPAAPSAPSPTAPPATPAPSPSAPGGGTTPAQPSSTPPTAAPAADWPARLAAAESVPQLGERLQECLADGGWDQAAAAAAGRRQFELMQAGG